MALGRLPLFIVSECADTWMVLAKRKVPLIHWLSPDIHREKSKVKNHLFNIWTIGAMRQNLSSTEGHAELIAHHLKNLPQTVGDDGNEVLGTVLFAFYAGSFHFIPAIPPSILICLSVRLWSVDNLFQNSQAAQQSSTLFIQFVQLNAST